MINIPVSKIRPRWLRNTTIVVSMPFVILLQLVMAVVAMVVAISVILWSTPGCVRTNIVSAIEEWRKP